MDNIKIQLEIKQFDVFSDSFDVPNWKKPKIISLP